MGGARVQAQELVGETAGQDVAVQVPAGGLVALEKLANVWPGGWVQPVRDAGSDPFREAPRVDQACLVDEDHGLHPVS